MNSFRPRWGQPPAGGLIVANHLGYLDVLTLAAIQPAVFVAKSEVRRWRVVGWLCARAGTIFVERGRRATVRPCLDAIGLALRAGGAVVLFPEGTSTGGTSVLPFKTSLLAAAETCPTVAAAIAYRMVAGKDTAEELCYWRDMTFVPHVWNVLDNPGFVAQLRFGGLHPPGSHRKRLAASLHAEVAGLRRQTGPASGTGQDFRRPPETTPHALIPAHDAPGLEEGARLPRARRTPQRSGSLERGELEGATFIALSSTPPRSPPRFS